MAHLDPVTGLTSILTEFIQWETAETAVAALAALPNRPAVYALLSHDGGLVQLALTQNLRAAVMTRIYETVESHERRADLAAVVRGVRYVEVRDGIEARHLHWRAARTAMPDSYHQQLGFGRAEFLLLDTTANVLEPRVSQQPFVQRGEIIGPFPGRAAAQKALEGLWDLFDLCRYPEQARRAPLGTRCAYAEMGRCDAPCDGSSPLQGYQQRVRESWRFACGEITAWIRAAENRMHEAAAALRFEKAALLKQQIAFAQRWRAQWPAARPLQHGAFLILAPVTRRRTWTPHLFRTGTLFTGESLRERDAARTAVRWALEHSCHPVPDAQSACETAWLLGHALYSRLSDRLATVWLGASADAAQIEAELRQRILYIRTKTGEDAAEADSGA